MYSIKENKIYEYEIKKSRFIGLIYKVSNTQDINIILNKVKGLYKDATHYCYSYFLGNDYHFSDDGEPGGTAGLPITEVLKKNNLTNVLLIVVRYFGGIKLGAGGLVRAYTKASVNVINECEIVELIDGYLVEVEAKYEDIKNLDNVLRNMKIVNKFFNDKVIYQVLITKDDINLIDKYSYKIVKDLKIEK